MSDPIYYQRYKVLPGGAAKFEIEIACDTEQEAYEHFDRATHLDPDDMTGLPSQVRLAWEDEVADSLCRVMCLSRSDAQGMMEAREDLIDALFLVGYRPESAAIHLSQNP